MIKTFISHRCKEYDKKPIQYALESFLKQKGLEPIYGCTLDGPYSGTLDETVPHAIEKGQIFIAFSTSSWKEKADTEGWPKKEWGIWKNTSGIYKRFSFGLLYNIDRKGTDFLESLYRWPIRDVRDDQYNQFLCGNDDIELYTTGDHYANVNKFIDYYIEEIEKITSKPKGILER